MSATPWRGTLIFAGGIAAVAVTAGARFAGADAVASSAADPAGDGPASAAAAPSVAPSSSDGSPGASGGGTTSGPASSGASSSSSAPADPAAAPSAAPAAGAAVTIVGSTVQTRFGPLQLSVTFDGSDVTDVQTLQYPSWHGESVQINQYAIPVLSQEAVAADSAKIDSVSGATITSDAYRTSLQAAIDQHG